MISSFCQAVEKASPADPIALSKSKGALDRFRVNVQEHASAHRSSHASQLSLFEQPGIKLCVAGF
jgi:hypothetical protein